MINYIITWGLEELWLICRTWKETGKISKMCYSPVKKIHLNTISNNKEVLLAEVTQERSNKIILFQVIL